MSDPRSILVVNPDSASPHTVVNNWQLGYRQAGSGTAVTHAVTATVHVEKLTEDASKVSLTEISGRDKRLQCNH